MAFDTLSARDRLVRVGIENDLAAAMAQAMFDCAGPGPFDSQKVISQFVSLGYKREAAEATVEIMVDALRPERPADALRPERPADALRLERSIEAARASFLALPPSEPGPAKTRESVVEIEQSFRDGVDHYLDVCKRKGEEPAEPFDGKLDLYLESHVHAAAQARAANLGISLNSYLVAAIEAALRRDDQAGFRAAGKVYYAYLRSDAAAGYSVDFYDMPGCVTAGDNREEAIAMAHEALNFHVRGMLADGDSIPPPSPLADVKAAAQTEPDETLECVPVVLVVNARTI